MVFDFRSVPLSQIRDSDITYKISIGESDEQLVRSIETIGLMAPPVLQPFANSYIVISGFKRIAACRTLGWQTMTAACLPDSASLMDCALVAIADAAAHRDLNTVELARAYHLLTTAQGENGSGEIVAQFERIGISINEEMVAKLAKILRMTPLLQQGLIDETIALPIALRIGEMPEASLIDNLTGLLHDLNLSLNRQRELLDWLEAIAIRENIPMGDLLKGKTLMQMREDPALDPGHKSNLIRQYFKKRRYPNITAFEQNYEQARKALKLPKGVQLSPPPHFEGQHFSIKVNFRSQDELRQLNHEIELLSQSDALSALLKTAGA